MEFVHPERLWFLFFLLIPIVIHLFHFRKRKTLYFSSLRFIQFLEKEQQSTRKLKHLLVLISRVLALAALIFVFDAAASVSFPLPSPLSDVATAITTAQSSDVIRSLISPIANGLFGGLLPEGLRALLAP
jgi:fatty acid desaturase